MQMFLQSFFIVTIITVFSKPLLKKRNYLLEDIEMMLSDDQLNSNELNKFNEEGATNREIGENITGFDIEKEIDLVIEFCGRFVENAKTVRFAFSHVL